MTSLTSTGLSIDSKDGVFRIRCPSCRAEAHICTDLAPRVWALLVLAVMFGVAVGIFVGVLV